MRTFDKNIRNYDNYEDFVGMNIERIINYQGLVIKEIEYMILNKDKYDINDLNNTLQVLIISNSVIKYKLNNLKNIKNEATKKNSINTKK